MRDATQKAQELAYALVALRAEQGDAQLAEATARNQARAAVRQAYDTANVDPTATLLASLSGSDPGLAEHVRNRRMHDAQDGARKLQKAVAHLAELNKAAAGRRTAAAKAAAEAVGAAEHADAQLVAAERINDEVHRQAELIAQRLELERLNSELAQSLTAVYASTHSSAGEPLVADSPAKLRALYVKAAATCPGLPWGVVAGIGQVETDNGLNTNISSAGAMGPMQFMPSTWAVYGVDGNGDGTIDILNQVDAAYSAAHYLCVSGGRTAGTLYDAIFAYNHSDAYVNTVLGLAAQYH